MWQILSSVCFEQRDLLLLQPHPIPDGKHLLAQASDPGEVAYILSVVNASNSAISGDNATVDDYYGSWARAW